MTRWFRRFLQRGWSVHPVRWFLHQTNTTAKTLAAAFRLLRPRARQTEDPEPAGQLTGSLAHDLNNELAVAISSLNLLQLYLARGDTHVQKLIDAARHGIENAVSLTRRSSKASQPRRSGLSSGKRLLVVEDEPMIALELAAILETAGFEVLGPARSLQQAHKLIADQHIDAALLDVNVAGQRIDDLAAALSRDNVPFAFLTGYGRENLPVAFPDAALVPKPFRAEQVQATVSALLSRS